MSNDDPDDIRAADLRNGEPGATDWTEIDPVAEADPVADDGEPPPPDAGDEPARRP